MNKTNNPTFLNNLRKYGVKAVAFILCTSWISVTVMQSGILTAGASRSKEREQYKDDSKVASLEAQLSDLNKKMNNLKAQQEANKTKIGEAMAEKQRLDTEMNLLIEKIEITETLVEELEAEIVKTEGEIGERELSYELKYEQFLKRLRVTHESGQISYLEMLFDAKSLSDLLMVADRVGAMLEYDSQVMESMRAEKLALETARTNFSENKKSVIAHLQQLESDKKQLEDNRIKAANYITQLQNNDANYEALKAQNAAAEEELNRQIEARVKELAEMNKVYVGGDFIWPLPSAQNKVSSLYGGRTLNGRYEFHYGIDIPAPYGTNIYAANTGTVVKAENHWSYGNYLMLDHGGGYITLYAHCSQLLVNVGDKVTKGQVIAKVGSTGYSTGNHLHFEMYEKGTRANPAKWFNISEKKVGNYWIVS